ncbi:MAG TPA: hypothetical protein VEP89_11715, partial [Draconibacterium sp.]|nr:hypothetical protein [Draconibacterium sp.]
ILFLLLQTYTNRGLNTVLDTSFKDGKIDLGSSSFLVTDSIMSQATNELNDSEKQLVDSLMNKMGGATDSIAKSDIQLNVETFRDASDLRLALNKYADKLEKQLETETDPKQQAELREFIRLCHSPETAMARILKYISYAFFLLLPIFALLLKLIYIRRKHNYMRHLVFSIHIHSFIFLVMTTIVAMYMIFEGNINTIAAILFLSVPIYIIIALKKFYGQTLAKVIAKFIMLSVTYYLIFFVVIFIASLDAIKLI